MNLQRLFGDLAVTCSALSKESYALYDHYAPWFSRHGGGITLSRAEDNREDGDSERKFNDEEMIADAIIRLLSPDSTVWCRGDAEAIIRRLMYQRERRSLSKQPPTTPLTLTTPPPTSSTPTPSTPQPQRQRQRRSRQQQRCGDESRVNKLTPIYPVGDGTSIYDGFCIRRAAVRPPCI